MCPQPKAQPDVDSADVVDALELFNTQAQRRLVTYENRERQDHDGSMRHVRYYAVLRAAKRCSSRLAGHTKKCGVVRRQPLRGLVHVIAV